ncbi:hypothetical protein PVAND_007388 [Polypedilum vanderplanki]|uniref:Odorant receptor n=1 Tax=Polypedilum vanderplanki TaxID=319348 RepID=A0A9J6C718_POLVA|nr:hypothetical protein PVAND_007388 [Polypedilum vanderplanki]
MKKILKKIFSFRNLHMDEIKTIDFIKFSSFYWKILMFNRQSTSSVNNLLYLLIVVNIGIYGICSCSCIFDDEFNTNKFALGASFCSTFAIVNTIYSCIYWNQEKIENILKEIPETHKKNEIEIHEIDKQLKLVKFVINNLYYMVFSSIIFLFGYPLREFIVNYRKAYPFFDIFSFPTENNFIYFGIFLWIFISHLMHLIVMIGSYNIFFGLITMISIEFQKLNKMFNDLKGKNAIDFNSLLKVCINRQNELSEIAEKLQEIFAPTVVVKFILSSFLICFTAFQCSTTKDPMQLILNILFCIFSMTQIFLLCFFGQIFRDSSSSVIDGIYDCGWENLENQKMKRCLILVLRKAQNVKGISIMNIWIITLNQFESVS